MGLANWLTVLRIVLIPVFVLLLVYQRPGWALTVFLAAIITDVLDGYVARRRRSQSRLGAFLDPLADKLLLTAAFVTLAWLRALPVWIVIVVVSRDLMLMLGALLVHMLGGRLHPRPTWAGKLATFLQNLTIVSALLGGPAAAPPVGVGIMWTAAGFTIVSGFQYLVQGMRYLNAADAGTESPPDGPPPTPTAPPERGDATGAASGPSRPR